jgi:Tfp pilus assembly protein PilO
MGKLFENIHWFIIAFAAFNIVNSYNEQDDRSSEIIAQQQVQRDILQKAKKTKREIAIFYKNIVEVKSRIEKVVSEIEKAQQILPSDISDTENIGLLRKMAEDVNIKKLSITPEKNEDREFYIARSYIFKAQATYLQFLIMFEKISENKRILNISEVSFNKLEMQQRTKFQLIDGVFRLEAYKYNSDFKEDHGIEQIEKEFKNKQPPVIKAKLRPKKNKEEEAI